uniref:Uncharacterized protein n=1 Tax=Tetraselmis chuii TaxID=63592 RepID=A0A7S1SLV3_9CHLO
MTAFLVFFLPLSLRYTYRRARALFSTTSSLPSLFGLRSLSPFFGSASSFVPVELLPATAPQPIKLAEPVQTAALLAEADLRAIDMHGVLSHTGFAHFIPSVVLVLGVNNPTAEWYLTWLGLGPMLVCQVLGGPSSSLWCHFYGSRRPTSPDGKRRGWGRFIATFYSAVRDSASAGKTTAYSVSQLCISSR